MKIETKFNIGDAVYYMRDNKVDKSTVNKIDIVIGGKGVSVAYWVGLHGEYKRHEGYIFANKEELLKSL